MNPGSYDALVVIQSRTIAPNDSGDPVETWITLHSPWCSMRYLRGRELVDAKQKYGEVDVRFSTHFSPELESVDTTMRIVVNTKYFDILEAVPVPGGRPDRLEIYAKTRSDEG